jgi:hypothetical protein
MKDDIELLKSTASQTKEIKARLVEKIKAAVNSALGSDAVYHVFVDFKEGNAEFQLFGRL